ncbi:hypothetical protein ACJMK2_039801 [Sinanodonta woodiana]|uniref:Mab-21-like HhH/H2TH-like domain-containing protein n=1 Tax=Sinanodonta woodiana TaxID=1069815 RepID=A0ABD3WD27_SINWO
MAETKPPSNEDLSLVLCNILNEMGYADKDVQYRIHIYELYDFLLNTKELGPSCMRFVGSKITGLSTYKEGDVDQMISARKSLITEDPTIDFPDDVNVFLMEYDNCPPGYCKLRLLTLVDIFPTIDTIFVLPKNLHILPNGDVYLSSKAVKELAKYHYNTMDYVLGRKTISGSGPANTRTDEPIRRNTDYVHAIPSRRLPTSMEKRFSRNKHWPSKSIVSEINKAGCEVVPVGFPGSTEEDLQWRLSFSTAEKILMQSLNSTQRKTYILLKIFFKECLVRHFQSKVLSTYIVKMLTLWMCETRPKELWKDDLLVERFIDSLKWLKERVEENHFPHYFIKERNLLANPMASEDKSRLTSFLSNCIESVFPFLLDCPSLANTLGRSLSFKSSLVQSPSKTVSWNDVEERRHLYEMILKEVNLASPMCKLSKATLDAHTGSMVERDILQYLLNEQRIREACDEIARIFGMSDYYSNRSHVLAIINNISCLKDNPNIRSVSAKVKLALIVGHHLQPFFPRKSMGTYNLLHNLITLVESQKFLFSFNERAKYTKSARVLEETKDTPISQVLNDRCLCEIVFIGDNLQLLPKGFKYNLYNFLTKYFPFKWIKIDCMALVYYLQTLVCEQLGKEEEANEAFAKLLLGSMGRRTQYFLNFEDRETTLNVAGHVYMERKNYRSAFIAIKHSVFFGTKVMASTDQSFLLLAVLLNKAFEAKKRLRKLKFYVFRPKIGLARIQGISEVIMCQKIPGSFIEDQCLK